MAEPKINLYDLLRVAPQAGLAEVQAAYRRESRAIESSGQDLSDPAVAEQVRLLRFAFDTLADPVSRAAYDRKLTAARPANAALAQAVALAPPAETRAGASADARADALALRADALALRADAILLRAGGEQPSGALNAGVAALGALKYFTRAIGLLVIVLVIAFAVTRCSIGGANVDRTAAARAKAREQTAIQEYFQTHGVRPASMAELEALEADRRRRENQARAGNQDRDKQEREARQFEEESRKIANEVSANLRASEEAARMEAEREKAEQRRQAEMKRYQEEAERQAERARAEQQQREWRESLRQGSDSSRRTSDQAQ